MNTIGTAMLHVTRAATADPGTHGGTGSISLWLAGWIARVATWAARVGSRGR